MLDPLFMLHFYLHHAVLSFSGSLVITYGERKGCQLTSLCFSFTFQYGVMNYTYNVITFISDLCHILYLNC